MGAARSRPSAYYTGLVPGINCTMYEERPKHRKIQINQPLFKYVIGSSSNVGKVDTGASIENRQTLLSSNLKTEISI